jgi:hypothetical protein
MNIQNRTWTLAVVAMVTVIAAATAANAAMITALNTASGAVPDTGSPPPVDLEANPYTISFDAGASADKLIVALSSELGGGGPTSITYDGDPLTQVAGTTGSRNQGIWYLDNPSTGGAFDLTFDMTNWTTVNGIGFGVVSIFGSAPGVAAGNNDAGLSVSLTTTVANSFVVTGYASNGGNTPTVPAGHTQLYTSGNIGSADGAAAYLNSVGAGPQTFTYVQSNPTSNSTAGAAFAPVPEPSTLALAALGLLSLSFCGRRRKRRE